MVKSGAVVIDCGAPRAEVDFENVKNVAGAITPVPGGVGPMTVISLLENLVEATYNNTQSNSHTQA
jgi:methylenetetrahydrofolate dehydrogenase (NADP+)/methenyltetrahydrofolate cyclohydrolase